MSVTSNTTRRIRKGATLPATCAPGEAFLKVSGGSEGLYVCITANMWILLDAAAGDGTVTSVSVVTANGVSGAVANPTTTPAITLTLGAITPSSVTTPIIKPPADSTDALDITKADGTTKIVTVDTTNDRIGISGIGFPVLEALRLENLLNIGSNRGIKQSLYVPSGVGSSRLGAEILAANTSNTLTDGAYLAFTTDTTSGVTSEKVRILANGNVGIGTDAPLSKLSINGGLHVGGDSDAGDNNALIDGTLGVTGVATFVSDPLIPDEAYGVGWNGSLEPPTKNAVYDKVETLGGGDLGTVLSAASAAGAAIAAATTSFVTFTSQGTTGFSFNGTEAGRQMLMPVACTLQKFHVRTNSAQPGAGSLVLTVRVNGVDTAITITIPAGAAAGTFSDLTNTASIAAGDLLSVGAVNNDGADTSAAMQQIAVLCK